MSDQQAYEAILQVVRDMAEGEARAPDIPVDVFVHEALRLQDWAGQDREALLAAGIPGQLL